MMEVDEMNPIDCNRALWPVDIKQELLENETGNLCDSVEKQVSQIVKYYLFIYFMN